MYGPHRRITGLTAMTLSPMLTLGRVMDLIFSVRGRYRLLTISPLALGECVARSAVTVVSTL